MLPVQKLDYYFFKAEKLIPDIAKITEGWDRIHLVVQWDRPVLVCGHRLSGDEFIFDLSSGEHGFRETFR